VLLDWRMPDMDGLDMLRQVYKTPGIELPRVVLMVATAEIEQAVIASGEFNINGIIAKPLTPSQLAKAVSQAFLSDLEAVEIKPLKEKKPLLGLRLLVAEDNALNREVIEQMLSNAGAQVVLVTNGQAALDALQVPGVHFDAVLLDIQMPVMDGYTAAKRMREALGRVDFPIIALSAHTRPQDREKARQAGMSGYLVKPLDVQALFNLVSKPVSLPLPARVSASKPQLKAALNLPGLAVEDGLKMFDGRSERYGQLLHQFMAQHGNDVAVAQRCFNEGNTEQAIHLLHELSGVAGFLQARELSRLAAQTEAALLDEKPDRRRGLFNELQAALDTVKASIAQLGAAMPPVLPG
jgi:CheY-like chemotaxis protein